MDQVVPLPLRVVLIAVVITAVTDRLFDPSNTAVPL